MLIIGISVVAHQPRIARRGAQLPGLRLLLPRPVERSDEGALRGFWLAFKREDPAFDPEGFGIIVTLFPARLLDLGDDSSIKSSPPSRSRS